MHALSSSARAQDIGQGYSKSSNVDFFESLNSTNYKVSHVSRGVYSFCRRNFDQILAFGIRAINEPSSSELIDRLQLELVKASSS